MRSTTVGSTTSSSESSWIEGDGSNSSSQHFSFAQHQGNQDENGSETNITPADYERQVLLLMLLAHVCALHDPTPRTFTVHVLELFERGILDRQSIHFLFDLGLVPKNSPPKNRIKQTPQNHHAEATQELAMLPSKGNPLRMRSMEASAIRTSLEQQEQKQRFKKSQSMPSSTSEATVSPSSWSVEHHPLSLSRYIREFEQIGLLSSGSFGQVFRATHKLDGRDYAIKRVTFSATGYSRESVQQVLREVHCLAVCDHPNVVRFYAGWLEPSWMTGSAGATPNTSDRQQQKLLTDLQQLVAAGVESSSSKAISDDLHDYFKDPSFGLSPRRRASFDISASSGGIDFEDVSQWTMDEQVSKDDSYLATNSRGRKPTWRSSKPRQSMQAPNQGPYYRYQICLFIQMQLCRPSTLADWIRERNQRTENCIRKRIEQAAPIFTQIAKGLQHVHKKRIVHRDLKPANIFASLDELMEFKIGDFGLSKMISAAQQEQRHCSNIISRNRTLLLEYSNPEQSHFGDSKLESSKCNEYAWRDPLTAGVGTASYASPEQVSSQSYGTEADIYSLGLILLELVCCFSTEHERLQTFHDCRHRRVLPQELSGYSTLLKTVLECTDPKPSNRPKAESLVKVDLLRDLEENQSDSTVDEVRQLKQQLADRERQLEACHNAIEERDNLIARLQSDISKLQTYKPAELSLCTPRKVVAVSEPVREARENLSASDSSSEDEM